MRTLPTRKSALTNGSGDGATLEARSVVLVTGASRGIGQSTATLLAEHGYTVLRHGPKAVR